MVLSPNSADYRDVPGGRRRDAAPRPGSLARAAASEGRGIDVFDELAVLRTARRRRRSCATPWRRAGTPSSRVGLMSGLINILYLTGSFYMLEVYDRVLPEPEHSDAGRPVGPRAHAVRLSGRARRHPLAHSGARRRLARRAAERPRLRHRGADAAARPRARRRARADARPRSDPVFPCRQRAVGAVRPAVDAVLRAASASCSIRGSASRRSSAHHPDQPDAAVRIHDAPARRAPP